MMFAKQEFFRMNNTARDGLRAALAQRDAAESALESAHQASARGRALIETITRQVEELDAASVRVASSMAAEMRAVIAGGSTPSVATNDREKTKNDVARTALDARRQAAEEVVGDFKAEEREREREVSDATAAVERAVRDILRVEAEAIAEKWAEVDLEARRLRIRLGVQGDPVWTAAGKSDAGCRATAQNFRDSDFGLQEQQAARAPWLEFSAALISDPDARLDFAGADRAIDEMRKERVARRAENERWTRGEAA
jgi:DNA repair exonuclease SbcCD ATPase subunit